MSEPCQAPQVPVKIDLRKIMTPEKEERLRLAREIRAKNRLMREEKRMEVAKQFLLASAGAPEAKTKSNPEAKKLKWQAQKSELMAEIRELVSKEKQPPMQPLESDSDCLESEVEAPPVKPKKAKSKPAAKPKKSAKRSQSSTANSARSAKKRKPVKPAVVSDDDSEEESSGMSEVEHENVLQLW